MLEYPIPRIPSNLAATKANPGSLIASPNTKIKVVYDGFLFRLLVVAKQDIELGQELRLNYGKGYWRTRSQVL